MKTVTDISSEALFSEEGGNGVLNGELMIVELNGAQSGKVRNDMLPMRFEAHSIVLVVRGNVTISINYKLHSIGKNSIVELFSHHVIDDVRLSPDCKIYHIIIGSDLFNMIMDRTGLMSRGNILFDRFKLIRQVDTNEMQGLLRILERIQGHIADNNLHFRREMVKSELSTFLLEYGNIWAARMLQERARSYHSEQKEDIISRFVKLLIDNCRKESEVSFYSTELCITPEHLSRVVKSMSGKSVNIWIREARITEAKILLRRPDTTIQQAADELNFADQSSFGKFFKKHTGKSPLEYKREVRLK